MTAEKLVSPRNEPPNWYSIQNDQSQNHIHTNHTKHSQQVVFTYLCIYIYMHIYVCMYIINSQKKDINLRRIKRVTWGILERGQGQGE